MYTACSPSTAPDRHKLAEFTSRSDILFRGSRGVVDMSCDSWSRRGHGSNFRRVIDYKLNPTASHGQGSEEDRKGSVRQVLQARKVRLFPIAPLAITSTLHSGNKATEPVRHSS